MRLRPSLRSCHVRRRLSGTGINRLTALVRLHPVPVGILRSRWHDSHSMAGREDCRRGLWWIGRRLEVWRRLRGSLAASARASTGWCVEDDRRADGHADPWHRGVCSNRASTRQHGRASADPPRGRSAAPWKRPPLGRCRDRYSQGRAAGDEIADGQLPSPKEIIGELSAPVGNCSDLGRSRLLDLRLFEKVLDSDRCSIE